MNVLDIMFYIAFMMTLCTPFVISVFLFKRGKLKSWVFRTLYTFLYDGVFYLVVSKTYWLNLDSTSFLLNFVLKCLVIILFPVVMYLVFTIREKEKIKIKKLIMIIIGQSIVMVILGMVLVFIGVSSLGM